jgi:hypothetical protein
MNVALKVTLKSTVKMLGEACETLEKTRKATDKEKDLLIDKAQSLAVFAAARVENILAHLEQDIDVDHAEEEQEYEALFKSAGF